MKPGIRGKLFAITVALVVVGNLVPLGYLEYRLRHWGERQVADDLMRIAMGVRESLLMLSPPMEIAALDTLADRLGEAFAKRVTIIGEDGRVLGDSHFTPLEVSRLENHLDRVEVQQALSVGESSVRRYSRSVKLEMVSAAVPFQFARNRGVVRVEVPLVQMNQTLEKLHQFLVAAGVILVAVTVVIFGVATHFMTRTLRYLVAYVRDAADGQTRWGREARQMPPLTRLPLAMEDEITGLSGSFNQILLELHRAIQSLGKERRLLLSVLDGMQDGVVAVQEDGIISLANRQFGKLVSSPAPHEGQSLAAVMPWCGELLHACATRSSCPTDLDLACCLDDRLRLTARVSHLERGWVVVFHDHTESYRLEQMRREFVANVAHELRTPVSNVLVTTQAIQSGGLADPECGPELLAALSSNAVRMSELIDDLLDLYRLDSGRFVPVAEAVVVGGEIASLIEMFAPAMTAKGITLEVQGDMTLAVMADRRALNQILMNLLDNAIKYLAREGRIVLRAAGGAGQVRLEVEDDGPGIPANHRERIFERFYRADPGRSRQSGGTGLGLGIALSYAQAMGGQVGVEPGVEQGSIFWVTLPMA